MQLHCVCGHVVSYHGDDGKCGAFAACRCVAPAPPAEATNAARRLALRDLARCCAVGTCDAATCGVQDFCTYTFFDVRTGPRPRVIVPKAEIRAVVAAALAEFGGSILCQVCEAPPDQACVWPVHRGDVSAKSAATAAQIKAAWAAMLDAGDAADAADGVEGVADAVTDANADDDPDPVCPNGHTYSRVWGLGTTYEHPVCDGRCLCSLDQAVYFPQAKVD